MNKWKEGSGVICDKRMLRKPSSAHLGAEKLENITLKVRQGIHPVVVCVRYIYNALHT